MVLDLEEHARDHGSTQDPEQEADPDAHEREVNHDRAVEASVDHDRVQLLDLDPGLVRV